ncbi:MAG TPA: hypothetical protein VGV37_16270 [Aliidongia sp.]|uniref:hypothetical protein n=1 Tax=Aliidongia sp. TaxID=1914230 RepID=UPI002DDD978C|nr:hypothetical protein [Aliidongia sp.]HEV2676080.1 hypothetical protein [Aliidongia sp.]
MSIVLGGGGVRAAAPPDTDGQAAAGASTLRDAVALMGQTYDFRIDGIDRLGTEAPDWPASDQPPAAVLKRLLRHYGYIAELKTGNAAAQAGMPQHLLVVGPSADRGDGSDRSSNPIPANLQHDAQARQSSPSALSRALGQLALSTHPDPALAVPARPTTGASSQVGALSGPSASAAQPSSNAPNMAALTNTARANLVGLVTSLQNACKGRGC